MNVLCILYAIVTGTLLTLVGLLGEHALPSSWPRRAPWCVLIPASLAVPGYYRGHHALPVAEATGLATLDWSVARLWLAMSVLLAVWTVAAAWHVGRPAFLTRLKAVDGVRVMLTDGIGPATVGLWRPRVLVPRWMLRLPREQRRYVLCHEEEHRRAHDPALLFLASLLLLLVPWNVALWWQLRRLRLAVEMDCDRRVVAALGDPRRYGELLLDVARHAVPRGRVQPALLGDTGSLERRLIALLAPTSVGRVERTLTGVLALALLYLVLTIPHPIVEQRTSLAPHGVHRVAGTAFRSHP